MVGQLKPHLVGMFIGWSSKKFIMFFLFIRSTQKKQEAQMCQNGFIFFETAGLIGAKLG
jgi:hypothetical protein